MEQFLEEAPKGGHPVPVLGLDVIRKDPLQHGVDLVSAGVAVDTLSEEAVTEAVRNMLLLQAAVNDGVHVSNSIDTAAICSALSRGATVGAGDGAVSATTRAYRESDTHVQWLHEGVEQAFQVFSATQGGGHWTQVQALLGRMHHTCLVHETLAAYATIYPLFKVSAAALPARRAFQCASMGQLLLLAASAPPCWALPAGTDDAWTRTPAQHA